MKISMIISAALLLGATAFAADAKNETTVDTSKNPITGTETTTTKHEEKAGDNKMKTKKVVKKHKDGKVETKVEADGKATTETPASH